MFSFGGAKKQPNGGARPKPAQGATKTRNLAQLGLLDMGLMDTGLPDEEDDDDEMSLEAELEALTRGKAPVRKKVQKPVVSPQELDAIISSSLRDIPSDAEVSDVDDAEVEDELNELCQSDNEEEPSQEEVKELPMSSQQQYSLIEQRLVMYQQAEKVAKLTNDTTKARRYGRGVKTLQDLLKRGRAGAAINMDDVPPALAPSTQQIPTPSTQPEAPKIVHEPPPVPADVELLPSSIKEAPREPSPVAPTRAAPPIPPRPSVQSSVPPRSILQENPTVTTPKLDVATSAEMTTAIARRTEFKELALEAKRAGDQATAIQMVRKVKACDQLISAAHQGESVDWSQLPLSVAQAPPVAPIDVKKPDPVVEDVLQIDPSAHSAPVPEVAVAEPPVVETVPQPKSTLEALEQRLAKYQSMQQQAQAESNSSKVRRMGRIVKQYQDAIKLQKAGKVVPFDELPTPLNYPPIPGAPVKAETDESEQAATPAATAVPAPTPTPSSVTDPLPAAVSPPKAAPAVKKTALATRQDKQLAALLERQSLFKQAALEAKKGGELSQAKEYLRMAKGLDPLIDANKAGIPVDMDTLPIPPQMKLHNASKSSTGTKRTGAEDGYEILSAEECALAPTLSGSDKSALLVQLEADLLAQLKICTDNRDHYKLMGDVANANRFDQLALHTRKDLNVVRSAAIRGDMVPRWKNEIRTFSIVKCCTDLKDDDMEVTIVRGLSYNVPNPKTIDTYVRYEVPIPSSDNPSKDRTTTVKDTNSPEYNQTFHVSISRQSRSLQRIFKAKHVKFEVWAKGGFLRSDTLLGTATVKLADLLNHCVVHEAILLMDGRKPLGGKLEVKIRIRDPIIGKEVNQIQEKWTVLVNQ